MQKQWNSKHFKTQYIIISGCTHATNQIHINQGMQGNLKLEYVISIHRNIAKETHSNI
jgi:hypothetical protein